jgi:hypothetical protein
MLAARFHTGCGARVRDWLRKVPWVEGSGGDADRQSAGQGEAARSTYWCPSCQPPPVIEEKERP